MTFNSGYEYRGRIRKEEAGLSVLDYLSHRYPHFASEEWRTHIELGRVLLNGRVTTPPAVLRAGEVVAWLRPPWEEPPVPFSAAILYLDEHMLIVAKPKGLPVLPGGGFMDHTLLTLMRRRFPEASPLHRLGRGTSGLQLFGRNPDAAAKLSEAWRQGQVLRIYRALVLGAPKEDAFSIDTPIGPVPHPKLGSVFGAARDGKHAYSEVQVLERRDSASLVSVKIVTGRPHQIRIHLAAVGHPLAGDPLYGNGGVPKEGSQALPGDLGYHLHAERLGFCHPANATYMEVCCMPPPILRLQKR